MRKVLLRCLLSSIILVGCFDSPSDTTDPVPDTQTVDDTREDTQVTDTSGVDTAVDDTAQDTSDVATDPFDGYNVVFVSSAPIAPGSLGGDISVAHAHCQSQAELASLPDPTSFVAFLSTSDSGPLPLLDGARGWVRPDGLPVVDQPADFRSGRTFYPIALTERGETPTLTRVLTGTSAAFAPAQTCQSWTQEDDTEVTAGNVGDGLIFWLERHYGFLPYETEATLWSPETAPSTTGGFLCGDWTGNPGNNGRFSYAGRATKFYSRAVSHACAPRRVLCMTDGAVD